MFLSYRYLLMTLSAKFLIQIHPDDVIYNSLPLYHTSGGILGIGSTLAFGNPVALRTKFSASAYWNDCIKYKCTVRDQKITTQTIMLLDVNFIINYCYHCHNNRHHYPI